jgi:hypothetical protein
LDETLKLHEFNRAVDDENLWIAEREPTATSQELPNDVLSALKMHKAHGLFAAEVASHEPLLTAVLDNGLALIDSKHYASADIQDAVDSLRERYQLLGNCTRQREAVLDAACQSESYFDDAQEAETYMNDKLPSASNVDFGRNEQTTQSFLVQHNTLDMDIAAHANTINALKQEANRLIANNHFASERIAARQAELETLQQSLVETAADRRKHLKETLDLHVLDQDVNSSLDWISDKLVIANSTDIGKDQEDCEVLQKKFADFVKSVWSNEREQVTSLVQRADAFVLQGYYCAETIKNHKSRLEEGWTSLRAAMDARRELLDNAHEIHKFNRDADELDTRIHDKLVLALNDDLGQDLHSVEALQRKHEGLERDAVGAIVPDVNSMSNESQRLCTKFPSQIASLSKREISLSALNEKLLAQVGVRKKRLADAHDLQQLFLWCSYLHSWVRDMTKRIESQKLASDTSGADDLLQSHSKLKSEIDARKPSFDEVYAFADKLLAAEHYAAPDVKSKSDELRVAQSNLISLWQACQISFEQSRDALQLREELQLADSWLVAHESIFANQLATESIDDVLSSMEKLKEMDKSLAAQEQRFETLRRLSKVRTYVLIKQYISLMRRRLVYNKCTERGSHRDM